MHRTFAFLSAVLTLGSCSADRHDAGQALAPATRIVSLVPSATELLVALGQQHRLVGRTSFDAEQGIRSVQSVGQMLDPNLEVLVPLKPDLVLVWPEGDAPGLAARLASLGLNVEVVHSRTLADLRGTVRRLGQITAATQHADSLLRSIDRGLDSVRSIHRDGPPVRVFYLVWERPLMTAGGGTFVDSLITAAGGINVFGDATTEWPTVSWEAVAARSPDVVVWPRPSPASDQHGVARAITSQLERIASAARIAIVDADLMARPGPRVVEAAGQLARLFHLDSAALP